MRPSISEKVNCRFTPYEDAEVVKFLIESEGADLPTLSIEPIMFLASGVESMSRNYHEFLVQNTIYGKLKILGDQIHMREVL